MPAVGRRCDGEPDAHSLTRDLWDGLANLRFPVLKGIRGLGMSDSLDYAQTLAEKFDYPNTYYDREPKFDIPWWINTNSDPMIRDIQRGPRSRGRSGRDGV
jgi:hypothetical protein